ncbi:MAG: TylF/MycF/NovP-related O-methyltransferase [Candidatus Acidiferrales bacterium]
MRLKLKERLGGTLKMWCASHGMVLAQYKYGDREARLQDVVRLKAQGRLMQNPAEGCQLISALRATKGIDGDIAEVGTALGGSARLIGEYSGGKTIHVFDTFEGLPEPDVRDLGFKKGAYACSLEEVQNYLKGLPVEFHKGLFPDSAASLRAGRFSFVHLDVDLYQSTLDCLRFFYPRMNPGGIIISHDYITAVGVDRAFAEFFVDKPEAPIELIGYQVMVVKLSQ